MKDNQLQSVFEGITTYTAQQMKLLATLTKPNYVDALKDVRAKLGEVYGRYGDSGTLNYAEMMQYNKLGTLLNAVDSGIQDNLDISDHVNRILSDTAATSYTRAIDTAPIDLPKLSNADITELLGKVRLNTATIEERLSLMQRDTSLRVQTQIKQDLLRGSPLEDTYRNVGKVFDKVYLRDMKGLDDIHHKVAQNAVQRALKTGQDAGLIPTKTWVTCGDEKVRPAHASLDGQTVDANDLFTVGQDSGESTEWDGYQASVPLDFNEPALDYNCRCWIVADWREEDEETTSTFAPEEEGLSEEMVNEMADNGQSEEDIAAYEDQAQDSYDEFSDIEGDPADQQYQGWQVFLDMEDQEEE